MPDDEDELKIVIDPGHGGHDSGAVGPEGLEEANTVLTLSLMLADSLADLGIDVLLTRESDVFVELYRRCEIANTWDADYFVSVHLNSNGSTAVGIETLYTSVTGRDLALPVQAH
jgi:N-acetylmuramoyl-L-alanine amidase